MAEITNAPLPKWTSAETRAQFAAITLLRWQMLRNSLRRKGGLGDVIAVAIMIPLFAAVILALSVGSGVATGYFVYKGTYGYISFILWGIFILCQLASIQVGQPGTTFDPIQLIRFPLNFRGYAVIRTFFGLISPANATSTLMSLAVAIGVSVVRPRLTLVALAALGAFALVNIFFTRMVFAWVDRWLSTRRAREAFTGLIIAVSVGIQYVNFTFNPAFHSAHHSSAVTAARIAAATHYYHRAEPILALLPPGLTAHSIAAAHGGQWGVCAAEVLGVLLFAALFFAVFAVRLYKEFRGENLSEQASNVATPAKKHVSAAPHVTAVVAVPSSLRFSAPDTIAAVFAKEFIGLRRNTGIIYASVFPLVMAILFMNLKMGRVPAYILFPAAVAYTMMGIAPLCYNSLGMEAAGIQFYFLAPVTMRDVFLAKNLFSLGLVAIEIIAVFAAVTYTVSAPSPGMTVAVLLWAAFTMFITLMLGNRFSVTSPKKIDLGKMGKQASPLSSFISVGVLMLAAGLGAGAIVLARFFDKPWILPLAMLVLAVVGYIVYMQSLRTMDKLLADNRDMLSETLCKA